MWFDCVVGETGEPGRHFRANLAQQHLPPSFAGDRLGTAGRGWWQRQRGRLALFWCSLRFFLRRWGVCAFFFFFWDIYSLFFSFTALPPLQVLFSKSSCPQNVQTRRAMNDASPYNERCFLLQRKTQKSKRDKNREQVLEFIWFCVDFHSFFLLLSVPHQGDVWAEYAGVCGG